MKTAILAALTALPFLSQAQQTPTFDAFPDNGVYLTASDFTHRVVADGFDTGQPGYRLRDEYLKHAVKITQPTTGEQEIPTSNLWGERIKDVDYRLIDGEAYTVEHADRIFVYRKMNTLNQLPRPVYYFSREADSPIYAITSDNLANVYYDQPDKKAPFDELDMLSDNPRKQVIKLTQLFYTGSLSAPTSAD